MPKKRDPSKRFADCHYDDDYPAQGQMSSKHGDTTYPIPATAPACNLSFPPNLLRRFLTFPRLASEAAKKADPSNGETR
jgi:hypothetical protein